MVREREESPGDVGISAEGDRRGGQVVGRGREPSETGSFLLVLIRSVWGIRGRKWNMEY